MNTIKKHLVLYLKGVLMGVADVVPGVSGGTIALLTGIYERLLNAIKSIDAEALRWLFNGKIAKLWKHVDGTFLLFLLGGIATSLVLFAGIIHGLLETHPVQIWAFFFGLVIISSYLVAKRVRRWSAGKAFALLIGAVIAYAVTSLTPATTPDSPFFLFISGAIAICAMILPGISGSFLLLILGKYKFVMHALKTFDVTTILIFALGCLVGLLTFSRFISWTLKRFHDMTVAVLAGFMVGSLNKIWPWKQVLETRLNSKGVEVPLVEQNILPETYANLHDGSAHTLEALALALGAIIVVYVFESFASKKTV
ncbi:DUF368 domain-containing protein [Fulvitalea axinellae]|uniref:DUF368 domain-containing protein n=1 Tax=Fulvitalea axinellae TaxID=1182444 RepID=A0AAU9CT29_9BACT|nr:DUF368 domain-containing protein [Fulvitalea axinellae]